MNVTSTTLVTKCLSGAHNTEHATQVQAPRPENKLKRDTPFVGDVRFRNDLPDLPCDPKLLTAKLNTSKLSVFALTQMEKALRPDLVSDLDPLGLPLIDIQRCAVPHACLSCIVHDCNQRQIGCVIIHAVSQLAVRSTATEQVLSRAMLNMRMHAL